MMSTTDTSTSVVEKLVTVCKDREAFWQLIGDLDPRTRVAVHDQLWDALMDTATRGGKQLSREDVTAKMQPSAEYQRRMGCTEPLYVCRRVPCINSNPSCVSQKISEHIEVIRQQLANY
jgi:hypothetical protein